MDPQIFFVCTIACVCQRVCCSLCVGNTPVCDVHVCVKGDNISGQGGASWAVVFSFAAFLKAKCRK